MLACTAKQPQGAPGASPRGAERPRCAATKPVVRRLECALDVWKSWYSYHVPCVHSFHEKVRCSCRCPAALAWPSSTGVASLQQPTLREKGRA